MGTQERLGLARIQGLGFRSDSTSKFSYWVRGFQFRSDGSSGTRFGIRV